MKQSYFKEFVCPNTHLSLKQDTTYADDKISIMKSGDGITYPVRDGLVEFIQPNQLAAIEEKTRIEYDSIYETIYDNSVDWLFRSFYEDEHSIRERLVDKLEVKPSHRILEVGCGTGRDSFRIAKRLGADGKLFLQDLSRNMVQETRKRLSDHYKELELSCELGYFISNATHLPFPDNYFDSVFHFGGFNNFGDKKAALKEFSRVVKTAGKVVCGDESLPPWLRDTTFGKIVSNNNALFNEDVPLWALPENARHVNVHWLLGECFYVIDFSVGEGTPALNLDLPHKGWRGGTLRSRYYGRLEGVSVEAKALAVRAAANEGISLHEWLDNLVKKNVSGEQIVGE